MLFPGNSIYLFGTFSSAPKPQLIIWQLLEAGAVNQGHTDTSE